MLVIVCDEAVDFVMDALTDTILGVRTKIDIDGLVNANTNVLAGVMTALEFAISESFKEFSC